MKRIWTIYIIAWLLVGCSALAEFAARDVLPSATKGGINTELVVGDKEQTLGSNQEVEADNIGKVVGNSDNSTDAKGAKSVEVKNINIPEWMIVSLFILFVLALLAPVPSWDKFKRWFKRG